VIRNSVFVSGLGLASDGRIQAGGASLVRFDLAGKKTGQWDDFTAVNGLDVDRSGRFAYLSQLVGDAGQPGDGKGNVVRFDLQRRTKTAIEVPSPAGVALVDHGRLLVAANSTSPAKGTTGGQLWRIRFNGDDDHGDVPYDDHDETTSPTNTSESSSLTTSSDSTTSDTTTSDTTTSDTTTSDTTTTGTTTTGTTTTGTTTPTTTPTTTTATG
jgi:hypothetical protein